MRLSDFHFLLAVDIWCWRRFLNAILGHSGFVTFPLASFNLRVFIGLRSFLFSFFRFKPWSASCSRTVSRKWILLTLICHLPMTDDTFLGAADFSGYLRIVERGRYIEYVLSEKIYDEAFATTYLSASEFLVLQSDILSIIHFFSGWIERRAGWQVLVVFSCLSLHALSSPAWRGISGSESLFTFGFIRCYISSF